MLRSIIEATIALDYCKVVPLVEGPLVELVVIWTPSQRKGVLRPPLDPPDDASGTAPVTHPSLLTVKFFNQ